MKAAVTKQGRRFCFGWRAAVLLLALALAGAIVGYFISMLTDSRIARGVLAGGVKLGRLDAGQARAKLREHLDQMGQRRLRLVHGERSWTVTPAILGLTPDYDDMIARAMSVGRRGSPIARIRERRQVAQFGLNLPLSIRVQRPAWDDFCHLAGTEVNQEPVSAHLAVDRSGRISVVPGRKGRILDRADLLAALRRSYADDGARIYGLALAEVQPALSVENIAKWPLDQVLGLYATKFNPGDGQRSHNLGMAADALDGHVIKPGDKFSFNNLVGPRIPDKGYLEAPVLQKSRLVLGMGGGVCQVSSTLFNAVLLANLPILERSNHSLPSTYVPLGQDATVVYGDADLVFANDTGRPILLATSVAGSYLTIAVVGHREISPRVTMAVEIKQKFPFETAVENDPGLAAGVEAVTQNGRDGCKLQLWRTAAWSDKRVVREPIGPLAYYPPVKKIVKHGIGSPRFGGVLFPPRPSDQPAPPVPEPAPAQPPAAGGTP